LKLYAYVIGGLSQLVKFCLLSFPLTLAFLSFYYVGVGAPDNFLSLLFAMSIPAYYYVIFFAVTVLLFPLYLVRHTRYLVIIPKVCLDFYLFVDLFIFNVYRFHIDALFISLMIHDFHGIGVPAYIIGLLILSLAVIVWLNVRALVSTRHLRRWPVVISFAAFFLCLSGQFLHAWGNEFHQRYITRYVPEFPYFFPMKARDFMENLAREFPAIIPAYYQAKELTIDQYARSGTVLLQYPLKKIDCPRPSGERYNILFFLLESWRFDMMNGSVTPAIHEFAKKSYVFTNHLSGGNVTHAGLFSLMYGLHPTYLRYMSTDPTRYPPVLLSVLKNNGYAISAYTSSNLNGFSLKKMFFQDIAPADYIVRYGGDDVINDKCILSELIRSIKNERTGRPFFKFVFLTSSHHGYSYPVGHDIFHPTAREGSFMFNKYADPGPLMNRYRNSLHYIDSLFGEVLTTLREAHLDKKTIIIVTSDHGEEFNDKSYGYWGHGSNFTRAQVSVPFILYLPDNGKGHIISRRSSHIDVAPTLLKYLFGDSPISDYSDGSDLFNLPEHRGLIIKSYTNKAYIIDDIVYTEGIPIDSYDINDINKKNNDFKYAEIEQLKRSEGCFVRNDERHRTLMTMMPHRPEHGREPGNIRFKEGNLEQ
jgi:hypothetical protein